MSYRPEKQEQGALLAFVNSFKLSRPPRTFDTLSDGRALMEVMSAIDGTHFKAPASRSGVVSPSPRTSENWVLKMNTLKRLHRLLLSYPLPPPHPANLGLSSMKEPNFSAIARSPTTGEGLNGLVLLCRLCLAVGVLGPANEKVIGKIQSFEEGTMASLMKSIEQVMATLPKVEEEEEPSAPKADSLPSPTAPTGRIERDELLSQNDKLRSRCEQMMEQVATMSTSLEEAKAERDEANERLAKAREGGANSSGINQGVVVETERLRGELGKTEESLLQAEIALEKQLNIVADLTKTVDELRLQAAEAVSLKDQLDEYRHTAERLQKSENVIEKYKKKLEESAGLRRELRTLEDENAVLLRSNAKLEAELRASGSSKSAMDDYRAQISALEKKTLQQSEEIVGLQRQVDDARAQLASMEIETVREREELQQYREQREGEAGSLGSSPIKPHTTPSLETKPTLGDELDIQRDGDESKTSLRLRIRTLEMQLAQLRAANTDVQKLSALQSLLDDANKARDRYQLDYLEAHRSNLRHEATLDQIRSGGGGDPSLLALQKKISELSETGARRDEERDKLQVALSKAEQELDEARETLALVSKDEKDVVAVIRQSLKAESDHAEQQAAELKQQIEHLKDKERLHLEELKKLLLDKVGLQAADITSRERDLEREKEFGDLKTALAAKGMPSEAQSQISQLRGQNANLAAEIDRLEEQLQLAMASSKKSSRFPILDDGAFDEAAKSYEAQIATLKTDLLQAREKTADVEQRYKTEQQLMLSAWHSLGEKVMREHLSVAGTGRRHQRPPATSWLGRQRRHQEEAAFSR